MQDGNQVAFTELFHKHFPALMVFAQRFVPESTAEDILSESFIKLWQQKNEFASDAQVHQWLKTTVRNAALNSIRQEKRKTLRHEAFAALLDGDAENDLFTAEAETNLYSKILEQIALLPAQQQRILRLFFLEGKDNAAIAEMLGISVQAVKNQKVTALKTLRKTFSKAQLILFLLGIGTVFHQ